MLGALGMFLSSAIKQLENFAGVMNFVIFPMFLPHQHYTHFGKLKKLANGSIMFVFITLLHMQLKQLDNHYTFKINIDYTIGIVLFTLIFLFLSIIGYDPARGNLQKKGPK